MYTCQRSHAERYSTGAKLNRDPEVLAAELDWCGWSTTASACTPLIDYVTAAMSTPHEERPSAKHGEKDSSEPIRLDVHAVSTTRPEAHDAD